jgi:hypothetical protein
MIESLIPLALRDARETVEITEIPSEKEIFTAKTDDGFVGCFRTDKGIFFTSEAFASALPAANAARRLKKEVVVKEKVKVTVKQSKPKSKKSSFKSKTKVKFPSRLYVSEEVEQMPLLSFREVWVITKGDEFVSDALNAEQKYLVKLDPKREKAKLFSCHEEAKRVMKVLKGTVGPGFDLKRFFVSYD